MKMRKWRDSEIRRYIERMRKQGYKTKEAIIMAAKRYFLSPARVRDIYYKQK